MFPLCPEANLFLSYVGSTSVNASLTVFLLFSFGWIESSLRIPELCLILCKIYVIQFLIRLGIREISYLLVIVFQVMTVIVTK